MIAAATATTAATIIRTPVTAMAAPGYMVHGTWYMVHGCSGGSRDRYWCSGGGGDDRSSGGGGRHSGYGSSRPVISSHGNFCSSTWSSGGFSTPKQKSGVTGYSSGFGDAPLAPDWKSSGSLSLSQGRMLTTTSTSPGSQLVIAVPPPSVLTPPGIPARHLARGDLDFSEIVNALFLSNSFVIFGLPFFI